MITVVETHSFIKDAAKLLSAKERNALIETIARDPEAGSRIPKTGGVRKLRFAQQGKGKSGSYRVIYYYYNEKNPVLLFTIFGKNQRVNISDQEKNELYQIVQEIKKAMKQ